MQERLEMCDGGCIYIKGGVNSSGCLNVCFRISLKYVFPKSISPDQTGKQLQIELIIKLSYGNFIEDEKNGQSECKS